MRRCGRWLYVLVCGLLVSCSPGDKTTSGKNEKTSSATPSPSPEPPPSVFQFHFLGSAHLATNTSAGAQYWTTIRKSDASQALWQQTRAKLAKAPYGIFQNRISGTNDFAPILEQFFDDFVNVESFIDVTGDTNRLTEYALALRLPSDRAEYWRTNLLAILESWGGRGESEPGGWQLKKPNDPNHFRLLRQGEWTIVGYGAEKLLLQDKYIERIKTVNRPVATARDSWLEVFFDWPNLPQPQGGLSELPAMSLALDGRNDNLRFKGDLIFREPFGRNLEPWQLPTNILNDPIISITAARGFAEVLKKHQFGFKLQSVPDQVFVWGGANFPVQTMVAAPLNDAATALDSLGAQVIERFDQVVQAHEAGNIVLSTNPMGEAVLRWKDIPPFVVPYVTVTQDSGRDFLVAGTYPNWVGTNPPVIFEFLAARTNLVYYDWEITAERAWSWRTLFNIFRHAFEKPRLAPNSASIVWINSVSNQLGNTVTEVSRSDSNRLSFVRQGPVGLSGVELVIFAHWLESPGFPLNALNLTQTNGFGAP